MSAPVQPTTIDRAMTAFRSLVKTVYPAALYWIVHEYAVAESDGSTFSGRPTDATFSPQLPTRVPYSPALAGSSSVVPVGTLAYVKFANGDPSKPILDSFGPMATSTSTTIDATTVNVGPTASSVVLAGASTVATSPPDAATQRRVVCYGDTVTVGVATGPLTLVSASCSKVRA